MKIKLAILEKDQNYLNRIAAVFSTKYADKFEIYSFTDPEIALSTLEDARIDVLVASDAFEIDDSRIGKKCALAYFVDAAGVETIYDHMAICRFQKAELIYKQILSVYSENAGNATVFKFDDDSTKVIVFSSPCGGVGTSTVAAACAVNYASQGKKTLYLNLEKFGSSDVFFNDDGQFDMSDVIYALKSRKTNLSMKLESCVKHDVSGVYFYSESKTALDMLELGCEDAVKLVTELKLVGSYDYIIIDADFSLTSDGLKLFKEAFGVVVVSDGSKAANTKVYRAVTAINIMEQNTDSRVCNNIYIMYNKFSNKSGEVISNLEIKNIGGAPRYEHASTEQIISQLSVMSVFGRIV